MTSASEAVALGKLRAAQARAIMSDEQRAKVDALVAQVPLLMECLHFDLSVAPRKGCLMKVVLLPEGVEDHRVQLG